MTLEQEGVQKKNKKCVSINQEQIHVQVISTNLVFVILLLLSYPTISYYKKITNI